MSLITMGRQIALYHPDIHRWVMSNPASYRDQGFNERLYAILNGIDTPPVYSDNGQLRAFVNFNKGYRKDREPIVVKEIIPRGPTPRELEKKRLIALANLVGSNCSTHGSKVGKFINRNRRMNAYLYELPAEEEGISFITCPVLGIRTLNIKKLYVSGVLLMSMDEFKERFPNAPLTCQAHAKNIAKGVNEEIAPGVTKHAAAVVKATVTRAAIGDDGLSINAKKGIKTRNTHMQRDENGLNGYQRIAAVARPKQRQTMSQNGKVSSKAEEDEWTMYRYFVDWLTRPHKKEVLDGRKTGLCGRQGAYQVDHQFSVIFGFKQKVSPWVVAHRENLRPITWEENASSKFVIGISKEKLYDKIGISAEQSEKEYECFFEIWQKHRHESTACAFMLERFNEQYPELCKKYPF